MSRIDARRCDTCGAEAPSRYNGTPPHGWFAITLNVLPQPVTVDACCLDCLRGALADNAVLSILGG